MYNPFKRIKELEEELNVAGKHMKERNKAWEEDQYKIAELRNRLKKKEEKIPDKFTENQLRLIRVALSKYYKDGKIILGQSRQDLHDSKKGTHFCGSQPDVDEYMQYLEDERRLFKKGINVIT